MHVLCNYAVCNQGYWQAKDKEKLTVVALKYLWKFRANNQTTENRVDVENATKDYRVGYLDFLLEGSLVNGYLFFMDNVGNCFKQ